MLKQTIALRPCFFILYNNMAIATENAYFFNLKIFSLQSFSYRI